MCWENANGSEIPQGAGNLKKRMACLAPLTVPLPQGFHRQAETGRKDCPWGSDRPSFYDCDVNVEISVEGYRYLHLNTYRLFPI